MQQWEYCEVRGLPIDFDHSDTTYAELTSSGRKVVRVIGRRSDYAAEHEVAHLIAQLGEEGWEMCGAGVIGISQHTLYFKRPK